MLNAYLSIFNYEFDICLLVGCNSNDIRLILLNKTLGVVEDNGFVRVFYLFGMLCVGIVVIKIVVAF